MRAPAQPGSRESGLREPAVDIRNLTIAGVWPFIEGLVKFVAKACQLQHWIIFSQVKLMSRTCHARLFV